MNELPVLAVNDDAASRHVAHEARAKRATIPLLRPRLLFPSSLLMQPPHTMPIDGKEIDA